MKFPVILPILTCLVALVISRPMPQTCSTSSSPVCNHNTDNSPAPSNARRDPQSSTAVSSGSILISDPCLPSSFQTSSNLTSWHPFLHCRRSVSASDLDCMAGTFILLPSSVNDESSLISSALSAGSSCQKSFFPFPALTT